MDSGFATTRAWKDEILCARSGSGLGNSQRRMRRGFSPEALRFTVAPQVVVCIVAMRAPRRMLEEWRQSTARHWLRTRSMSDESKPSCRVCPSRKDIPADACAERGEALSDFRGRRDSMTWLTASGSPPHHGTLRVRSTSTMTEAGCLGYGSPSSPKRTVRLDNGNDVARRLNQATNPLRHFGTLVTVDVPMISFTRRMLMAIPHRRGKVRDVGGPLLLFFISMSFLPRPISGMTRRNRRWAFRMCGGAMVVVVSSLRK